MYIEKTGKIIPIGIQEFAYQCENIIIEPSFGKCLIMGFIPHNGGKQPYPNDEADSINNYELEISKFTGNSIQLTITKNFKDGRKQVYTTNTSFSILVNCLFKGGPSSMYEHEAPMKSFT